MYSGTVSHLKYSFYSWIFPKEGITMSALQDTGPVQVIEQIAATPSALFIPDFLNRGVAKGYS